MKLLASRSPLRPQWSHSIANGRTIPQQALENPTSDTSSTHVRTTMATFFQGVELVNAKGETARGEDVLAGKVVALFFSADWCPYCHDFLPALQKFYEEANSSAIGKRLEVVFVSSDSDNAQFAKYFEAHHGPWWGIPYTNETLRQQIKVKYEVAGRKELAGLGLADRKGGLPTLLVVNSKGDAVDYEGVEKVNKLGLTALEGWELTLTLP